MTASGTITSQRIAACPIEPRAAAARVEDDDRLTVWLSTQTPHQDRDGLAAILGTDPGQIRVLAPDVGGGFGGKGLNGEYVLVAYLARKTGKPVRWTETRTENLIALPHGRAQRIEFKIGGRRDGTDRGAAAEPHAGRRRVSGHRCVPPQPHGADGQRRLPDPEDRRRTCARSSPTRRRPRRSAAPAGRRRRRA